MGLARWLSGKESACECMRCGLGRSPGGGDGKPLQYSCLGNSTDRGAWWATVHRGHKRVGHDLVTTQTTDSQNLSCALLFVWTCLSTKTHGLIQAVNSSSRKLLIRSSPPCLQTHYLRPGKPQSCTSDPP